MALRSPLVYCIVLVLASDFLPTTHADADRFKYGATVGNDYGPADWGKVKCANENSCPGWPTKFETMSPWIDYNTNTCKDCSRSNTGTCLGHRQSPIALYKNVTKIRQCIDIHKMGYNPGKCAITQLKFRNLPHVLRVEWPKSCPVTPQIDFSRHSPDPWNMRFMDITVPSQHTIDGKRYAAEITLSHTYSVKKTNRRLFIGNMNVLIAIGGSKDHNAFLELFLTRFERQAANIRASCYNRRMLGKMDVSPEVVGTDKALYLRDEAAVFEKSLEFSEDLGNNETVAMDRRLYRAWDGYFHPYVWHLLTGSQYYFNYRGSWVEPPCLEDLTAEWRVMKEPIKISPSQFARLDKIFYLRLNPKTCVRESAGTPRAGARHKRNFNRPIQTTTDKHELTYCECIDFTSGYPKDKAYCAKSMAERGVYPFRG